MSSEQVPVISARTADGAVSPVAYRLNCTDENGRVTSVVVFPGHLHLRAHKYRMDGYDVETEPLFELPEEMVMLWMGRQLLKAASDDDKNQLNELLERAIGRSARLQSGEIARHGLETLFVAVRRHDDEVTALVFPRADGAIYSRYQREWVRTSERFRPDDEDPMRMIPVGVGVVGLFDERRVAGWHVGLAELKRAKLIIEEGTPGDARRKAARILNRLRAGRRNERIHTLEGDTFTMAMIENEGPRGQRSVPFVSNATKGAASKRGGSATAGRSLAPASRHSGGCPSASSDKPRDPIAEAEESIFAVVQRMRSGQSPLSIARPFVPLEETARFGVEHLGHTSLGQTLTWAHTHVAQLPDLVSKEIEGLYGVSLQVLNPTCRTIGQQFLELRSCCSRWDVFAARCLGTAHATLEELGARFGLTRERIRQIVKRESEILRTGFPTVAPGFVDALATLKEHFGVAVSVGGVEDQLWRNSTTLDGFSEHEAEYQALLLWLAGYQKLDGYWTLDPDHRTKDKRRADSLLGDTWLISQEQLDELALGKELDHRSEWRVIGHGWRLRLDGSAAQKAGRILALTLRPMTPREIVAHLSDGTTERNLANQLSGSDLFCRTDKYGSVALVDWGMEEYSGIVEEIRQRVERGDGTASAAAIVVEFTTKFGVSESSIRSYLKSALFKVEGDVVTLVEDPEAAFRPRDPGTVKGSIHTDLGWGQVVTITQQHLGGYSFVVNPHIAAANGIPMATDVLVPLWVDRQPAGSTASLIWRPKSLSGVDVGRCRQALIQGGIQPGSELVVVPAPEAIHILTDMGTAAAAVQWENEDTEPDPAIDFLLE